MSLAIYIVSPRRKCGNTIEEKIIASDAPVGVQISGKPDKRSGNSVPRRAIFRVLEDTPDLVA